MLRVSLIVNIIVLVPVLVLIAFGGERAVAVYGPDGAGLRILGAIYATILLASMMLLALIRRGDHRARPWAQALLALQVVYKVGTLITVGPTNPVVLANLAIAALHAITLSRT